MIAAANEAANKVAIILHGYKYKISSVTKVTMRCALFIEGSSPIARDQELDALCQATQPHQVLLT